MNGLSPIERALARRAFVKRLSWLRHATIYWIPSTRELRARSANPRKRFKLPPDAARVGVYAYPFNPDDFLEDLDDCLERLRVEREQLDRAAA